MSAAAISVHGIGKEYRIGRRERARTLRDMIAQTVSAPVNGVRARLRRGAGTVGATHPTIWALKDVSFQIQPGEVVGVIGRNGAGKSTLLKVLSRITHPTQGYADVVGRIGSLLEVGTGFHPELSGRENVFLNGAILGMSRQEIVRKFDEIVAFSGVEQFIDTPVKRYSSGMHVRLAFSVAAHLEPEILLVDEVLAVGDAEFQQRCLGKMRDVTNEGRTVMFVSHNMQAIRQLCHRVLLIDHGGLERDGLADTVIGQYLYRAPTGEGVVTEQEILPSVTKRGWDAGSLSTLRCLEVRLSGEDGLPRAEFRSDEPIRLAVTFSGQQQGGDFRVVVSIVDDENTPILTTQTADQPGNSGCYELRPGTYRAECQIPPRLLGGRRYFLSLTLALPHIDYLVMDKVIGFETTFAGHNNVQYLSYDETFLRPVFPWSVERL